jgi:hypothetical protein
LLLCGAEMEEWNNCTGGVVGLGLWAVVLAVS